MTYGELKRRLRRLGVVLGRQGSGHELWFNPATGRLAPIARHNQREVSPRMLQAILRELGLPRRAFDRG